MTEVSLVGIKKNFGFKNVLNDFDLEITTGDKVALIGPNGSGKSTIFKLISKEENPDKGTISIRKGASVAMLSQMPPVVSDDCDVKEILLHDFDEVFKVEKLLRECEEQMAICQEKELEKLLNRYSKLQQEFTNMDGYALDEKVSKVCNEFKISTEMLSRKFNSLSGGEKTLIHLASLIINNPDILLLDEPTNNLDINTLEWLEKFLSTYKGTVIISSHDRYFLDKVVNKVVLIERGKSEIFHGNYSYYLEENERRIMAEFEQYKDQQKQIDAMKRKIKQLQEFGKLAFPGGESFFKRAASIQKRLDKLEILEKPEVQKELPINFNIGNRSGKQVLNVKNLNLSIDDNQLLENITFNLLFKDKVCLMGSNGCGKSTLIKYILKLYKEQLENNEVKIGSNVVIGYIPQVIMFEDDNKTILEVARKYFEGTETHLRAALARFMFNGDNVFKKVGTLSGGEKVRLKLFELIQQNINFLIMDEPTNHIDITTKEVLENALKEYQGTVFFISHDRYFINELAQRILYIENKGIKEYNGNYDYYCEVKKRELVKQPKRRY